MAWTLLILFGLVYGANPAVGGGTAGRRGVNRPRLGRSDDLCAGVTDWKTYTLNRIGYSIKLSEPQNISWVDSFCCCRSQGSKMLSLTSKAEFKDLYSDLVELGVIENTKEASKLLGYTDFHALTPNLIDIYGTFLPPDIYAYPPNKCVYLLQDGNGGEEAISQNNADCEIAYEQPIPFLCTEYKDNVEISKSDSDHCFRDGRSCTVDRVKTFATTGKCPQETSEPTTCPTQVPCTTKAPPPKVTCPTCRPEVPCPQPSCSFWGWTWFNG